MARVGLPVPGVEGASEGPCELPICCADTDAIVAIIEHPKTATPTTTTDPATIIPPCTPAVVNQQEPTQVRRRSVPLRLTAICWRVIRSEPLPELCDKGHRKCGIWSRGDFLGAN